MARITVEDCIDKFESRFELVLVASNRARKLHAGESPTIEKNNDKHTVIALREIGDGKLSINDLEKNAITRLRKEPDEVEELEETEEEVNDDFEKLYKGQVSKSGIAVLPSKRTRRTPDQKPTSNLAKEALSELKSEQPEIKEENLETEETPLELKEEASPEEENKSE